MPIVPVCMFFVVKDETWVVAVVVTNFYPVPAAKAEGTEEPVLKVSYVVFTVPVAVSRTFLFFIAGVPEKVPVRVRVDATTRIV